MATFVAMFYSQRSRKILLEASKNWDTDDELFDLLKKILHDKYLKTASRVSEDYRNFSDDTFQNVLYLLHNKNPKSFPYDPFRVISGFRSMFYIGRLYKLLNIDYKIFDYCYTIDSGIYTYMLAYSNLNEELEYYDYRIDEKGTLITEINSKKKNIKYDDTSVFDSQDEYYDCSNNFIRRKLNIPLITTDSNCDEYTDNQDFIDECFDSFGFYIINYLDSVEKVFLPYNIIDFIIKEYMNKDYLTDNNYDSIIS